MADRNDVVWSPPFSIRAATPGVSSLMAAASGAILSTAFISSYTVGLWVGLSGVFYCTRLQKPLRAARTWAIFGLVFFGISFGWLSVVTWAGFAVFVAYHSLHVALMGLAVSYIMRGALLPLASVAPAAWVVSEFLRSRLLGGLPWLLLAHPLGENIVFIQFASVTGAVGVSFLVVMVNAAMAELAFKIPAVLAAVAASGKSPRWKTGSPWVSAGMSSALVAAACVHGLVRLESAALVEGPRVALLQGAVPTRIASEGTPAQRIATNERLWRKYSSMTEALEEEVDLIIWPESALPGYFGAGARNELRMRELSRRTAAPIIFGSNAWRGPGRTNSALMVDGGELLGRHDKEHLVPFGEYVPFEAVLGGVLGMQPMTRHYDAGEPGQQPFRAGRWTIGASICYEDIFPELARRSVLDGAEILVNLTNDSWFDGTAEPVQHWQAARFRAVELGVPLVRATNTGVSCVFDPYGRSYAVPGLLEEGTLVTTVSLRPSEGEGEGGGGPAPTPYGRHGDLFAWCCLASVAFMAMLVRVRAKGPRKKLS